MNLLGGRARTRYLHPLTYTELRGGYDLHRAARRGLLPSIYFSDDPRADLDAYAGLYLQQELVAYRDYVSPEPLTYWRSTSGFEVDFLIGDHTAIEVKATTTVATSDIKSLNALAEERRWKRLCCVCLEPRRRRIGDVIVLPWNQFLDLLWGKELS